MSSIQAAWLRIFTLSSLLLGLLSAQAQARVDRTQESIESLRKIQAIDNSAFDLARQARLALRKRDFIQTERSARQSIVLTDSISERNPKAREILAEMYLIQGNYGLVLAEVAEFKKGVSGRFAMTQALALLGLGRKVEARKIIAGEVGLPEKPTTFAENLNLPELPYETNDSDAALRATALIVRGAVDISPEGMDDLTEAVRLVPSSAVAHFHLGEEYGFPKKATYEAEVEKALSLAGPKLRPIVKQCLEMIGHD